MALIGILFLIFTASCVGAHGVFATLECNPESFGKHGQQSMLQCVVIPKVENLEITMVCFKKEGMENASLVFYKGKITSQTGYIFAEPSWNSKNMNVSLLITNTMVAYAGVYQYQVLTNYGHIKGTTNLKVTAKYSEPIIRSVPEKITQNSDGALICDSVGGYPQGEIHWKDEHGTDWTKSSEMEAEQGPSGLFHLSSKLTLLRGSIFPKYTCEVVNASGGIEASTEFGTEHKQRVDGPEEVEKSSDSTSKIVAPVVVIGSLIVGMLMVLLYLRRRQNGPSTNNAREKEEEEEGLSKQDNDGNQV